MPPPQPCADLSTIGLSVRAAVGQRLHLVEGGDRATSWILAGLPGRRVFVTVFHGRDMAFQDGVLSEPAISSTRGATLLTRCIIIVADAPAGCDACEGDGVFEGHRDGCVARFLLDDHPMPFRVFSPLQKLKNNCGDLGLPVAAVQLMKPWAVMVMSALHFASW